MTSSRWVGTVALVALLAGCGDSGGGSSLGSTASVTPTPATTTLAQCSLRDRQDWAFATLNEWYLFPETLPSSLDPTPYASVDTYIDALTATARAQRRDRYFTYLTSIAQENAFYASGSSAGFGMRLSVDATAKRAFIAEAFEGTSALAAGLDRGSEILAIGNDAASLRTVSDVITAEGSAGVTNALGPSTTGLQRTLRFTVGGVARTATITKTDYALVPVSARYGAKIIDDGGRKVGYLNLRTFISTADDQLRTAFGQFRAAGVTNFVIDFRYNGGGLVSTAELMGDLLGGNRSASEVFSNTTWRASKSGNNSTKRFAPTSNSVSPVKLAFIGTGATASASELVINGFVPYLGRNEALVGANTYGKPVGQTAIDRAACDDRLRVIAFSLRNGANSDAYYDGLAGVVGTTCAAGDDLTKPLGDPQEASVRRALDFIAGTSCTPIATAVQTSLAVADGKPELLTSAAPTVAQREVPGLF